MAAWRALPIAMPEKDELLGLFAALPDAAIAVAAAQRAHGADRIAIERERIDEMQAVRAAWPLSSRARMDAGGLRRVVSHLDPSAHGRVHASPGAPQRIAVFVSKRDDCIADLLQESWCGRLRCEIALVVSNHEDCRRLAELYGVPYHHFELGGRPKKCVEADQLALLERERST